MVKRWDDGDLMDGVFLFISFKRDNVKTE